MPSPDAKAAFNEAQRIAVEFRDIHSREIAILGVLGKHLPRDEERSMEAELKQLRHKWSELMGRYTSQIGLFTQAVERARKDSTPR